MRAYSSLRTWAPVDAQLTSLAPISTSPLGSEGISATFSGNGPLSPTDAISAAIRMYQDVGCHQWIVDRHGQPSPSETGWVPPAARTASTMICAQAATVSRGALSP